MGEFLAVAVGFPAVIFSAALVMLLAFWLLVLLVGSPSDGFDADMRRVAAGLGGTPVTLVASPATGMWMPRLFGPASTGSAPGGGSHRDRCRSSGVVTPCGLVGARARAASPAGLLPDEPGPSRLNFVGSTCDVRADGWTRTSAKRRSPRGDGSAAVVQTRGTGADALTIGSTGLQFAHDEAGEFFRDTPCDAVLDPRRRIA
ncbi:hypothetical protein ACGF4C_20370 [Streptomyces sp. NPDC048197]|uniref:hypothetical protein n=1 Tax=Streptomyces sp. NPDC048197 TaxID=3365511 RepID=UPI00371A5300